MDPTACFKRMMDAYREKDLTEAMWASEDLAEWIMRGGFCPDQMKGCDDDWKVCTMMLITRMQQITEVDDYEPA